MYRQSPSRNQRSRGFKVKHVLQICLLLAVCFWLIYQVKHSHDKRKEFGESDGRSLLQRESGDDLIKLGRKDVQSRLEGIISKNEKHEEPEEASREEEEENKSEEDELEDKKVEGKEDEAMGGEDDDIDEHELEKSHEEVDREEDMVDEEKEREEVVENETQETDSEDSHGRLDKEISAEEGDHDGDDGSVDEAREEHYKADDASSAVTHDAQIATTENENEHLENSTENPRSILEEENEENNGEGEIINGQKWNDLPGVGGEVGRDDRQSNMTTSDSDSGSSTNNTEAEGVDDAHLTNNSIPEITTEDHNLRSEDVIENKPELDLNTEILISGTSAEGSDMNATATNPVDISVLNVDSLDSNSTHSSEPKDGELHSKEFSNSSNNNNNNNNNTESSSAASEKTIRSEASVEAGNNGSLPEGNDEIKAVNTDINDGAGETLEPTTESHVDDLHDAIDISDTSNFVEEKDVRTDLDTIPEIQIEGTNSKDVAAE